MRLIDADTLELDAEWDERYDGYSSYSAIQVHNSPTIEAEPVRHGRNISCMNPVDGFLCSECHTKIEGYYKVVYDEDTEDYNHYEYEFKYCPNCGARMDGEE